MLSGPLASPVLPSRSTRRYPLLIGALALALLAIAPGSARAVENNTGDAFVCMVSLLPRGADPAAGSFGYLYIQVSTQAGCAGTNYGGYLYSTGATYTGSDWRPASLYSEAGLMSVYQSLVEAAQSGKRVQMFVSNQAPHFQVHATTLKSY